MSKYSPMFLDILLEASKTNLSLVKKTMVTCYSIQTPLFFGGQQKKLLEEVVRAVNAGVVQTAIFDYLLTQLRVHDMPREQFDEYVQDVIEFFETLENTIPLLPYISTSLESAIWVASKNQEIDIWNTFTGHLADVVYQAQLAGLNANTNLSSQADLALTMAVGAFRMTTMQIEFSKFGMMILRERSW